jgi:ParB/RepB/Spo0J family partition protein
VSQPAVADAPAQGHRFEHMDRRRLVPWPGLNPRSHFDPDALEELAASIEAEGVLQNLVVHDTGEEVLWIVAGESRWRAANMLGERGVEVVLPVRVEVFTEARALKIAILENKARSSLSPLDEARGIKRYQDLTGCTQAELAAEFFGNAKSQPVVANRLKLLDLPDEVQQLIAAGKIEYTQARTQLYPLLRLPEEAHAEAFGQVVARVRELLEEGETVSTAWLSNVTTAIERGVRVAHETEDMFGGGVESSPELDAEADQRDRMLRLALMPNDAAAARWFFRSRFGATDAVLQADVRWALEAQGTEERRADGLGAWRASGGTDPYVMLRPLATAKNVFLRRAELLVAVRRVLGITAEGTEGRPPTPEELATIEGPPAPAAEPAQAEAAGGRTFLFLGRGATDGTVLEEIEGGETVVRLEGIPAAVARMVAYAWNDGCEAQVGALRYPLPPGGVPESQPGAAEDAPAAPAEVPADSNAQRIILVREMIHGYPSPASGLRDLGRGPTIGATDAQLETEIEAFLSRMPDLGPGVTVPGVGTYRVIQAQTPAAVLAPLAAARGEPATFRAAQLVPLVRLALNIGSATPAQAAAEAEDLEPPQPTEDPAAPDDGEGAAPRSAPDLTPEQACHIRESAQKRAEGLEAYPRREFLDGVDDFLDGHTRPGVAEDSIYTRAQSWAQDCITAMQNGGVFPVDAADATPAPASAPAQPPAPAPAPAPPAPAPPKPAALPRQEAAPPAAPVATIPLPGAERTPAPDGAGIIETILAALGGRPFTLVVLPGSGGVTVTLAPKLVKAGEKPFLLMGQGAADIDARLVPAINSHFTI